MAASSVRAQRDGRIAVVRIDAGDERNLMSRQVMTDMPAAARGVEDDATTSAIVLTGTSRVFTLGFDLSGAAAELPISERPVLQALGTSSCSLRSHLTSARGSCPSLNADLRTTRVAERRVSRRLACPGLGKCHSSTSVVAEDQPRVMLRPPGACDPSPPGSPHTDVSPHE